MKRVPVVSTIIVALAVAAMIALGFWQLDRRREKAVLLAQLAANEGRPAVRFPTTPYDDALLFRPASATCRPPIAFRTEGAGASGFRILAQCRAALVVQIGTTRDAEYRSTWGGGAVAGYIGHAPDHRPLIAAAFDHAPQRLMLVAARPAPGLSPNPPANLADVPNNHLAYAVQWFAFAAIACVIYALLLARRFAPAPARG